ncbi:hypothetical protein D187_007558 [Cystobacter fuscus DSM 2262]|uniref:Uncharacterized protein n=1 Tax=Cystobacter fuscus (strain ATCC 25194 / DSM 2262 / NBRC 100088 / M29) TaxID=1242864 RepID=S9NZD3_CYSF2|nr:hypothetical protein D187_007558 [Cystobacter fuscus DSM 2262]
MSSWAEAAPPARYGSDGVDRTPSGAWRGEWKRPGPRVFSR